MLPVDDNDSADAITINATTTTTTAGGDNDDEANSVFVSRDRKKTLSRQTTILDFDTQGQYNWNTCNWLYVKLTSAIRTNVT